MTTEDPLDIPPPSEGDFVLHSEDEFYEGAFRDIDYIPPKQNKYGKPQLKIWFLPDEDAQQDSPPRGVPHFVPAYVSKSERNGLRQLVQDLGDDPNNGVNARQQIHGRRARVMFSQQQKEDRTYEKIDKVRPSKTESGPADKTVVADLDPYDNGQQDNDDPDQDDAAL